MFKKFIGRLREESNGEDSVLPPSKPPARDPASGPPDKDPRTPGPDPGSGIAGFDSGESDGHRSGGVVQSGINDTAYRERSEMVDQIDALFGDFGPSVSSYMLTQALSNGGVKRVTAKLELRSRGREGADLALIANWINSHGVERFCRAVGLRFGPSHTFPAVEKPQQEKKPKHRVIDPNGEQSPKEKAPSPRPQAAPDRPEGSTHTHKQKVSVTPVSLSNGSSELDEEAHSPEDYESEAKPEAPSKPFMFSPKKPSAQE